MIQIVLCDREKKEVAKLEVDPKLVANAGLVIYKSRYYGYGGLYSGPHFRFFEVDPPVDLSDVKPSA